MANIDRLDIDIGAKTDRLKAGISQAEGQLDKFGSSVKKLAGALGLAFGAQQIMRFGMQTLELADQQLVAEQKLLTALKGRTDIQQTLIDQAGELQKKTRFGDEATIEAQALLAALGLTGKEIQRIIPGIQDMATAMNMDLVSAASMAGKSITTTTDALQRYFNTGLSEVSGQTERAAHLTEALTKKFHGQAEALRNIGTGPMKSMIMVFGDFREEIGKTIVSTDGFRESMNSIIEGLTGITNIVKWIADLKGEGMFGWMKDFNNKYLKYIFPLLNQFALLKEGLELLGKVKAPPVADTSPAKGFSKPNFPTITPAATYGLANLAPEIIYPEALSGVSSKTFGGFDLSGMTDAVEANAIKLKRAISDIKEPMLELGVVVQQTMMGVVDSFAQGVENLFAGTAKFGNFFEGILKMFGQFAVNMGKLIIAYGVSMISFKQAFAQPHAAIIAGAALVAIGAAISGLASAGVSGGGGGGGAYSAPQYSSYNLMSGGKMVAETKLSGRDLAIVVSRGQQMGNGVT